MAQSRIDALAVQRETGRLDLLAETAQRYLAVVGADRQRGLADMDVGQRQPLVLFLQKARHILIERLPP